MTPGFESGDQGTQLICIRAAQCVSGWSFVLRWWRWLWALDQVSSGLTWLPALPLLGSLGKAVVLGLPPLQDTQLLRNSQLLPSPTLSFQTKPVKTDLRWQLWPHLATACVHGSPAGFESQTLSTPDAHEARTDTVFETHPGKICPGTRGCDVFLLAPSKPNGAEYLHPSPSLYCRHRLTALQSCSRRKALLPAGSHRGSQSLLLPWWGPQAQGRPCPPHAFISPVALSSVSGPAFLSSCCSPLMQVLTSGCINSMSSVASVTLTLCDPMDCSLPGPSVHGILQARILQWIATPSSRASPQPRDRIHVSCVYCWAGGFFTSDPPGKPIISIVSYYSPYSSHPQPFWHQGLVSWKTIFLWMGNGVGWGRGREHIPYIVHFISNISFNSDHQVLDSGGWGPLSYTVPFLQKGNVARLFFPKYKPSVTLCPCSKPFWGPLPYPSIVLEARLPVFEPGSGICPYCVTGGMTLNLYASGSSLWSSFNNLPIRVAWGRNKVVSRKVLGQ